MGLVILRTDDGDLNRVQQNVARELERIEGKLPSSRVASVLVSADYQVRLVDQLVLCKAAADINVTLPEVSTCAGRSFIVKNLATAANVNVRGVYRDGAAQAIDGASPYVCPWGTALTCYSDGKAWWVV